jgi:hypothetical protein
MYSPHHLETTSSEGTGWASFIGIVICLCGNVIISFALNLQRLAHERIQTRLSNTTRTKTAHRQGQEIEAGGIEADYGSVARPTSKDADDDQEIDDEGTQYLKSNLWWTGLILMCIGEIGNFVACTLYRLCGVDVRWICTRVNCCAIGDRCDSL